MNYKPLKIRLELDGRKCRATWLPGCQTPGRSGRGHTISDSGAASAGRNRMPTCFRRAPGPRETRTLIRPGLIESNANVGRDPRSRSRRSGEMPRAQSPGTTKSHAAGLWRAGSERPARTGGSSDRPTGQPLFGGGMSE